MTTPVSLIDSSDFKHCYRCWLYAQYPRHWETDSTICFNSETACRHQQQHKLNKHALYLLAHLYQLSLQEKRRCFPYYYFTLGILYVGVYQGQQQSNLRRPHAYLVWKVITCKVVSMSHFLRKKLRKLMSRGTQDCTTERSGHVKVPRLFGTSPTLLRENVPSIGARSTHRTIACNFLRLHGYTEEHGVSRISPALDGSIEGMQCWGLILGCGVDSYCERLIPWLPCPRVLFALACELWQ